jgi:hypothetical protein
VAREESDQPVAMPTHVRHMPKWRDDIRIRVSSSGSEEEKEKERRQKWLEGIEGAHGAAGNDETFSRKLMKAGSSIVQQLSPRREKYAFVPRRRCWYFCSYYFFFGVVWF